MLQKLQYYGVKLREAQTKIQTRLDNMTEPEYESQIERYEDVQSRREEQIEALDEIMEILEEVIDSIENYNSQWDGLKSIK